VIRCLNVTVIIKYSYSFENKVKIHVISLVTALDTRLYNSTVRKVSWSLAPTRHRYVVGRDTDSVNVSIRAVTEEMMESALCASV